MFKAFLLCIYITLSSCVYFQSLLILSELWWFNFHFCLSLSYITYLEAEALVSSVCVCLCVCVCPFHCLHSCKRDILFSFSPWFPSCSPHKQTHACLQMKTNIDEIKLEKEYLISELNVWIKLGFLYWIKPVGISSIWENRGEKNIFLFDALLSCHHFYLYLLFSPCHSLFCSVNHQSVIKC